MNEIAVIASGIAAAASTVSLAVIWFRIGDISRQIIDHDKAISKIINHCPLCTKE